LNHEQIDAIAAVLRQSRTLTEVEVRSGSGVSLRLRRAVPKAPPSSRAQTLRPSPRQPKAYHPRPPLLRVRNTPLVPLHLLPR
jgi:hypothetical protein